MMILIILSLTFLSPILTHFILSSDDRCGYRWRVNIFNFGRRRLSSLEDFDRFFSFILTPKRCWQFEHDIRCLMSANALYINVIISLSQRSIILLLPLMLWACFLLPRTSWVKALTTLGKPINMLARGPRNVLLLRRFTKSLVCRAIIIFFLVATASTRALPKALSLRGCPMIALSLINRRVFTIGVSLGREGAGRRRLILTCYCFRGEKHSLADRHLGRSELRLIISWGFLLMLWPFSLCRRVLGWNKWWWSCFSGGQLRFLILSTTSSTLSLWDIIKGDGIAQTLPSIHSPIVPLVIPLGACWASWPQRVLIMLNVCLWWIIAWASILLAPLLSCRLSPRVINLMDTARIYILRSCVVAASALLWAWIKRGVILLRTETAAWLVCIRMAWLMILRPFSTSSASLIIVIVAACVGDTSSTTEFLLIPVKHSTA